MLKINKKQIYIFLHEVDSLFPIPLSKKCNLADYVNKLYENATICVKLHNNQIVSMVAGYTENLVDNIAYISLRLHQFQLRDWVMLLL